LKNLINDNPTFEEKAEMIMQDRGHFNELFKCL